MHQTTIHLGSEEFGAAQGLGFAFDIGQPDGPGRVFHVFRHTDTAEEIAAGLDAMAGAVRKAAGITQDTEAFSGLLVDAIIGRGLPTPAHALWAFDRGLVHQVGENPRAADGWAWRRDVLASLPERELEQVYVAMLKAVPQ